MKHSYLLPATAAVAIAVAVPAPQTYIDPVFIGVLVAGGCAVGYAFGPAVFYILPFLTLVFGCFLGSFIIADFAKPRAFVGEEPEPAIRVRDTSNADREGSDADLAAAAASQGLVYGSEEFNRRLGAAVALIRQESRSGGALDPANGVPGFWPEVVSAVRKAAQNHMLDMDPTHDDIGLREMLPPQFLTWVDEIVNIA